MSNLFSQDHDQSPGTTFHAPLTHSIPRLKPHNTVSCCSSCGVAFAFRLFHRKHNCYNCGNVICGRCSEHKVKLPKFGYFEPVRICNLCHGYLEIMEMSRSQLVGLPTKRLREYISAYNLPCYNIIEKDDLINVIMAHRPMEGRYEVYYRDHYPIAQPVQTFHETASAIPPSANHARTETQNNASHSRSHYQNTVPPPPPPPRQPSPRQPSRQPSPRQPSPRQPSFRQPSPQQLSPQQPSPQQLSSQQQRPSQQHRPNYQSQKQPPSDTAPISLQTIIRDKVDVSKLSIKIIKEILKENCIDYSKMVEKSELVERLEILIKWAKHEMSRDTNDISDDGLCRICCDAQSNCLFMDCGHMCTCLDCGKKLLETKNECPICRETIIKMIRVFRA